jgi:hypothetical protein
MAKGGESAALIRGKFLELLQDFTGGFAIRLAAKSARVLGPKPTGLQTVPTIKTVQRLVQFGMAVTGAVSFANPVQDQGFRLHKRLGPGKIRHPMLENWGITKR